MIERLLSFIERYPLDFTAHLSSSLPIIIGFTRFSFLNKSLKIVWYLFIFFFLKDTYALIHMFLSPNILYIQNLEAIINVLLVGILFYYSVSNPVQKKIIVVLTLGCTAVTILFYSNNDVSSVSLAVFRAFSIILSMLYFNRLLVEMNVKSITKHSMFWFTSGLLIYATGTFFSMLFSEYWYQSSNKVPAHLFDKYWNRGQLLFIVFSLFSAYGLWVSKYDQENIA